MGDFPLFCNGIPKAGSHLLLNILRQLPKFEDLDRRTHWMDLNRTKVPPAEVNTLSEVKRRMRDCFPGEIMKVHLAYEDCLANVLRELEAKHIVIFRDPRGIVLSMADYWDRVDRPDLWPWRYYHSLPDRESKLRFLIEGWPQEVQGNFPSDVPFPDIGSRVRQFVPWLEDYQTMVVRYEDLVDPNKTRAQLKKMVAYLHNSMAKPKQEELVKKLALGMDPSLSQTYLHGKPDRWRKELSPDLISLCDKYAGSEMVLMGYPLAAN